MEYTRGGLLAVFGACGCACLNDATEIRLRQNLPLSVRSGGRDFFLSPRGVRLDSVKGAYLPTARDISATLEKMANHSLYAYDSEIKNGFITLQGGHRVGICGRVTMEGGKIKTIRHVSGLTMRFSRQVLGAADKIFPIVSVRSGVYNTLIISPPGQGKTTVLRDIIRLLSIKGFHVSVVDERSEIAGSRLGAAQNDLGPRVDVMDGVPKAEGMLIMLRAMSPDIIAVDEIGHEEDAAALLSLSCCGIRILATLHGEKIEDLQRKPALKILLENKIFDRYVFLTNMPQPGSLLAVYDNSLRKVEIA
jgi:stage III sporulation protein AA